MTAAALAVLVCLLPAPQDRVPWTGSRVQGTPEDPPPFRTEREFPKLRFQSPVDLLAIPGTGRLAVAELGGRILSFENRPDVDRAELLADVRGTLLGMAFHPDYARNGLLFVIAAPDGGPWMTIRRLSIRPGSTSGASELLRWPFGGVATHAGGALRFGPDGFLYAGIGDGSAGRDERDTGQDLRDLEASILRIDVDRTSAGLPYAIPRDNPFTTREGARPEIWAYGVRQPWKMAFDPANGDLWVGDVGQERWESVLRVRPGDNFGWSALEGGHPYRGGHAPIQGPVAAPVITHPHSEFRALIGGLVYRGAALAGLAGSYVYGDYETGRIWELRVVGGRILRHRELARSSLRLCGFGEDARGELLLLNHNEGALYRLVPQAGAARNAAFPRRLSETGLFASVRDQRPAPGVIPYEVASPLWSDGASKERFLALPGSSKIRPDSIPNRSAGSEAAWTWDFPDGTVLVKTFRLGTRKVETRLLHLQKIDDAQDIRSQVWHGYSYQWNEEQTDADLVDAAGRDVETTYPGPDGPRRQIWHYPSRNQCLQCHDMAAQFVLGATTLQMNRDIDVPGVGRINQLDWLRRNGLFETPFSRPIVELPRLVDVADESQPLELRARSYLHANCAHCHIPSGGGNSEFRVFGLTPPAELRLIDAVPVHGSLGIPDARLLAPGSPERSLLLHRMAVTGEGRMPPLASSIVDVAGTELLARWIRRMPAPGAPWAAWSLAAMPLVLLLGLRLQARRERR